MPVGSKSPTANMLDCSYAMARILIVATIFRSNWLPSVPQCRQVSYWDSKAL